VDGAARLRAVVDRSGPPHRPVGDDLLSRWYIGAARRLVAVMPVYGIRRAIGEVTTDFAGLSSPDGVGVTVRHPPFTDDAGTTFASLAGTSSRTSRS
jgi:hypothetical protein